MAGWTHGNLSLPCNWLLLLLDGFTSKGHICGLLHQVTRQSKGDGVTDDHNHLRTSSVVPMNPGTIEHFCLQSDHHCRVQALRVNQWPPLTMQGAWCVDPKAFLGCMPVALLTAVTSYLLTSVCQLLRRWQLRTTVLMACEAPFY
jgi:hypothetical protein